MFLVYLHLQIFTDRAARREISEVEVHCDYCEWTEKEKYLQVMFRGYHHQNL